MAGSADIEIAQRSVRGSLLLFIGNFLQTLISAAGIIVIARLLVPDDYGLFTLSFVIPNLILLFLGLGVNVAVTRFAAYYLSIGKPNEAKRFTRNAVLFLALFGIAFSALNYVSAGFLSSVLLRRPEISQFVQAISVFILGQALFQASIASLIGWNSMKLASASQVVQAILKIGFSVALVLAGFGVMGAVLGHAAAWLLAGGIATTALYIVRLGRPFGGLAAFSSDVKEMVRYGLPLYAGSLISGLASSYLVIILAAIASNTVVGYYAAANNVTVPIGLASSSIASALLPAFASLDGTGGDVAAALRHAVKYVAYLVTPVAALLISAAPSLFELIYTRTYSSGIIYLQLLSIANLPIVLGATVLPTFFSGVGRTRLAMVATASGAIVLLVLAPLLGAVSSLGVAGLIYAILLSTLAGNIVGLVLAARYMHISIDYRSAVGVLAASLLALGLTLPMVLLLLPAVVTLLGQIVVFTVVYFTAVPLLRGIDHDDVVRLEVATRGLGPLAVMARPILRFERRILELS